MEDVIVTSVKKILKDSCLPINIRFNNDKTLTNDCKGSVGGNFPKGSTNIDIVNEYGVAFEQDIVGLYFKDILDNVYTVLKYEDTVATLDKPLALDMTSDDIIILRLGDELKVLQLPSSFALSRGTVSNKLRYRVKGFDLYINTHDDLEGNKAEFYALKIGKIFSKQAYPCYNEKGEATGEHFIIELNPTFTDISNVVTNRVVLGRVRFGKYEAFSKI